MTPIEALSSLAVAVAAGGLIGAEREQAQAGKEGGDFGGIRTFPLLAMVGVLSGWLRPALGGWVVAALLGALTIALAVAQTKTKAQDVGVSSEVAAVITFALGVVCGTPELLPGVERFLVVAGVAATTMALLALKRPLHGFAARLSSDDIYATVKFVLLAAVLLPVLPNRAFDPFQVLNPYKIGRMIALVAGVSFAGYVAARAIGSRRGLLVAGLIGGIVSSTALTLALSSRAREQPALAQLCGVGIVAGCSTMPPRLLVLIGVVDWPLLAELWVPLGAMTLVGYAFALFTYFRGAKGEAQKDVTFRNPFALRSAVVFGLIYAVILFVSAAAQRSFGTSGVYASAGFAGLADVDAIALSLAELARAGAVKDAAAPAIVLAVLVNTVTKAVLSTVIGGRALALRVVPALAASLAAGALGLALT